MTFRTLIRRSLRFHARSHLGVVLGAAVGSAALIGALIVGDSVRQTLRERALQRLANAYFALAPADRFISRRLELDTSHRLYIPLRPQSQSRFLRLQPFSPSTINIGGKSGGPKPAPERFDPSAMLLALPATATLPSSSTRVNHVQVFGADEDFWNFTGLTNFATLDRESVVLNQALAAGIGAHEGDDVLLRVQRPGSMSREAAIMQREDQSVSLRLKVVGVLPSGSGGDLDLKAAGNPAMNAFVNLGMLSARTGLMGKANVLLSGPIGLRTNHSPKGMEKSVHYFHSLWSRLIKHRVWFPPRRLASTEEALAFLEQTLQRAWTLTDADLKLDDAPAPWGIELRSPRVFLEPPVVAAAERVQTAHGTNSISILTYLANLISVGSNVTPYSMVTSAGPPYTPAGLRDDEIVLSDWLAEDLGAKPGDLLHLSYFQPDSGARLAEATNRFRVHSIVPLSGIYADRTLMPDFPGIEKAESTRDWDAAFPLVYKIRQKDEQYWKERKGTPKAFITLAAGQKMWANRFGALTCIRLLVPPGYTTAEYRSRFIDEFLETIKPQEVGLRFEPVREQALKAAEQSQDFGQLFLGFSIFLVVAAVLLMALLFQFGLERRATEVGTLLALGFTPKQVRRLLLIEGVALAFLGGMIGAFGGIGYAKAMLWALTTVWRNAVGTSMLTFHATPVSLVIGLCASTIIAVITIWLTLRKQARRPARELLAGEVQPPSSVSLRRSGSRAGWIAAAAGAAALGIIGWALVKGETSDAEAFFGAGALLLVGGLAFAAAWLGYIARKGGSKHFTLADLGVRGCARRRKRSLATVALLACGSFVVLAIGVFRLDANQHAEKRSSGTGGFALIGESTMPVVHDLNSQSGREAFGLSTNELGGVGFVQFRVRDGDEASCLNLNRAQKPRLLGVRPEALAGRFTFAKFAKGIDDRRGWEPWELLRCGKDQDEIPAIGDASSIQWALGKKIGDTLDYTDERGRAFKLRLVAAVANSILQGNLIIDEAEFLKRFPSESGYRMFLIDAPSNSVAQVSASLSRALQDTGLELTPAVRRLNAFNAVQNTYLGTFQVLGGLGLLLGSAGLGVVVLRNVLERRGELGVLTAIGFRRRALQKLVLSEHGALLGLGLGIGIVAAAVAVLPALLSPGTQLPYGSLALTLGAVLLNGLLWTWLATRFALRGNLLEALRNE